MARDPRHGRETRRAYGIDVGDLARWAGGSAAPDDIDYRRAAPLRRAPVLTERRGAAPVAQTVARKLASIRAFFRHLVERGEIAQNPADLVSPRKPPRRCRSRCAPTS